MTIDLKSVVSKQIPEFVRDDYPLFVEFIEAYYEYMDQYEKRNLESLRDIDETLDSYIKYFKDELDILGANYGNIDPRLFLRKSKQLFTAKGTEASYKLLFKMLYNLDSSISYPWDQVLKVSDGKWQQDHSMFINITGDATKLPGNYAYIVGTNIKIRIFVTRVALISGNIYEVFISNNYYGKIELAYTLDFDGIVTGTLLPTTSTYTVYKPGSGYKVGDLINGNMIGNTGIITQLLKVTRVDSKGGIVALDTLRYGYGYTSDFLLLDASSNAQTIATSDSTITIDKNLTRQYSIPDTTVVEKYVDYGNVIKPNYSQIDYTVLDYAAVLIRQFYQESRTELGNQVDFAMIKFDLGAVTKYPGYYTSNDGFLDDEIYIQDSYRWQKYSYVITVDEKLDNYKTLVKSYLHPAGTELFGNYEIAQNTSSILDVTKTTQEVSVWSANPVINVINSYIRDTVLRPMDMGGTIIHKDDDDNIIETITFSGLGMLDVEYQPTGGIFFIGDVLTQKTKHYIVSGTVQTGGEAVSSLCYTYYSTGSGEVVVDGTAEINHLHLIRGIGGALAGGIAARSKVKSGSVSGTINTSGSAVTGYYRTRQVTATGTITTSGNASYTKSKLGTVGGTITIGGSAITGQ